MSGKLKTIAIIGGLTVGCTVAGAVVLPLALGVAGFGSAGVAAGSLAAASQTPNIVAGSAFAIAQSIGATGAATLIGAKVGIVTGAATGVACDVTRRYFRF